MRYHQVFIVELTPNTEQHETDTRNSSNRTQNIFLIFLEIVEGAFLD